MAESTTSTQFGEREQFRPSLPVREARRSTSSFGARERMPTPSTDEDIKTFRRLYMSGHLSHTFGRVLARLEQEQARNAEFKDAGYESTLCQATQPGELCIRMANHEGDHLWRADSSG